MGDPREASSMTDSVGVSHLACSGQEEASIGEDNPGFLNSCSHDRDDREPDMNRVVGTDLVFRDVSVSINNKSILKNVSGLARGGQMLAVMGPSGAGKSTLLNSLSGRQMVDSGAVTINGIPISRRMRRKICYVVQSDIFFPFLTLRETLKFTAYLRLPDTMSKDLKMQRVDEIIASLDLKKCENTAMGGLFVPGLSGGEKKRASIACELLTNPKILLLDEPTSGLDSAIAFSLMSTLKQYTQNSRKTVVTTIHQPSSQIFYMFDNILLIANGEVAYFGRGENIMDFFSNIGLHCALHYNPADFILEKVKEGAEIEKKIIGAAYGLRKHPSWPAELRSADGAIKAITTAAQDEERDHKPMSAMEENLNPPGNDIVGLSYVKAGDDCKRNSDEVFIDFDQRKTDPDLDIDTYILEGAKWQTSFWTQYSTLTQRNFLQARSRILSKLNFFQTIILAVAAGVVWFDLPRNEQTINDRMGVLYFMSVYFSISSVFDIVTSFPDERGVVSKERSSGAYRLSAYFFAKMTTESPLMFLLPTIYCIIVYWMANLSRDPASFFSTLFVLYLTVFSAQSIGLLIGVSVTDFKTSVMTSSVIMLSKIMAGGYYNQNLPSYFQWIKYCSLLYYSFAALVKVEFLHGEPFQCNPPNKSAFSECISGNSTFTGDAHLDTTALTEPLWFDLTLMCAFLVVFRFLAYIVLRFLRRPTAVR